MSTVLALLFTAWAAESPDDTGLPAFDDLEDPAVQAWGEEQSARTLTWLNEGDVYDQIVAAIEATADWEAEQVSAVSAGGPEAGRIIGHTMADPETADLPWERWAEKRSIHTLTWVADGAEPRVLEAPEGSGVEPFWSICGTALTPDGKAAIWGRREPDPDPSDPSFTARPCHVFSMDAAGSVRELGVFDYFATSIEEARFTVTTWEEDTTRVWTLQDGTLGERETYDRRLVRWTTENGTVLHAPTRNARQQVRYRKRQFRRAGKGSSRSKKRPFRFRREGEQRWTRLPRMRRRYIGSVGDDLVLLVDPGDDARIVRIRLDAPDPDDFEVLLEQDPDEPFEQAWVHAGDLVLRRGQGVTASLTVRPIDGSEPERELLPGPFLGVTLHVDEGLARIRTFGARNENWIRHVDGRIERVPGSQVSRVAHIEKAEATSADGTRVPLSIGYPTSARDDDSPAPVWLQVYGGFGISQTLWVSTLETMWLERGGIVAQVHARGGGELGDEWHEAATGENIARTYEDVIAAAEWFIEQGHTEPGHIVLSGFSNGGTTSTAVVALRPELFGAVMSGSGLVDLVNARQLGWWNRKEYGKPRDEGTQQTLARYSPVEARPEHLPPVLLTTGQADPTVNPLHSYRLAAAWEHIDGGPVLLRVHPWTSHAQHLPKKKRNAAFDVLEEQDAQTHTHATMLAFFVRALELDWTFE